MSAPRFKFFLITQVFHPDETATASIFTDIATELAQKPGYDVEVWCGQPSYSTRVRQPAQVAYRGVKITYLPGSNFNKSSLAGRLCNYATFSAAVAARLLVSRESCPTFTVTNPPFLGILVQLLSRLKGRPYVFVVHDVQPDGLLRLGKLRAGSLPVKLWTRLNRRVLLDATRVIVIGRDMIRWVATTAPRAEQRTLHIGNCQREDLVRPADFDANPFVIEHQLSGKFVVQYSGNMGLWNDMAALARAASALSNADVYFCFIGDGMRRQELLKAWGGQVPVHVKLLPFQPRERLGESLTACHVALISLSAGLEGIAVPSKLYGMLAAGVAIVAQVPAASEVALVVEEEECGIVVPPGDDHALVSAIRQLRNDPDRCRALGERARAAFEQKYTVAHVAAQYGAVLEDVVKQSCYKREALPERESSPAC